MVNFEKNIRKIRLSVIRTFFRVIRQKLNICVHIQSLVSLLNLTLTDIINVDGII